LSQLTRFFVLARFLGGGVVLGVRKPNEGLVAVATILKPGRTSAPVELIEQRQSLWRQLGADARARYERYGAVTGTHVVNAPHYHLAMVGVRRSHTGRGLARHLLDAVHNQSREDPGSCGVTLNTEDPRNVRLYEHFGYQLIGHDSVPSAFDVWSFFRADD
jgi:ribosomal protein S18 acetylase RimI-like enzyme